MHTNLWAKIDEDAEMQKYVFFMIISDGKLSI